MNQNSNVTQLNCLNKEESHSFSTDDLSSFSDTETSSADDSCHALTFKKNVADKLQRKWKCSITDNAHQAAESKFQKSTTSASEHAQSDLQINTALINKLLNISSLNCSHNASASLRSEVQSDASSLRVKDKSSWESYDKDYLFKLSELVTVIRRRHSVSELMMIKKLSDLSADVTLSVLCQIQDSCFMNCVEIFHFRNALHVILKYMTMSLLQIVTASQYLNENQITAIIDQMNFPHCWKTEYQCWRMQILHEIEFLESHNMIHSIIICSSILVSQQRAVKIDIQHKHLHEVSLTQDHSKFEMLQNCVTER